MAILRQPRDESVPKLVLRLPDDGMGIMLHLEDGRALPNQASVHITNEVNDVVAVTVKFLIDGSNIDLAPAPAQVERDNG